MLSHAGFRVCLDAIDRSKHDRVGNPADVPWLQPYPDRLLDAADLTIEKETIELVFLVVIQQLPPRQRAGDTALLKRYVAALKHTDRTALADVLSTDVRLTMPPEPVWYAGRDSIVSAIADVARAGDFGELRGVATGANRQPAVAWYRRRPAATEYEALAIDVLWIEGGQITEITGFGERAGVPNVRADRFLSRGGPVLVGMLLKNKIAVVYGAGGYVGGAVARAFAREGAKVHLAGRTAGGLTSVASIGNPTVLDATDEQAVDDFVDHFVAREGRVDISFNAIMYGDVQGASLLDLTTDQITGYGEPWPNLGSTMISWHAVEGVLRQLASDLGPHGIRTTWLRTAGFHESMVTPPDYGTSYAGDVNTGELVEDLRAATMLKRHPTLAEAGDLAAFLSSDRARSLTAAAVNITAGAASD